MPYVLTISLVIRICDLIEMVIDVSSLFESNGEINDLVRVGFRDVGPARSDIGNGLEGLVLSGPVTGCCGDCTGSEHKGCNGELHDDRWYSPLDLTALRRSNQ